MPYISFCFRGYTALLGSFKTRLAFYGWSLSEVLLVCPGDARCKSDPEASEKLIPKRDFHFLILIPWEVCTAFSVTSLCTSGGGTILGKG